MATNIYQHRYWTSHLYKRKLLFIPSSFSVLGPCIVICYYTIYRSQYSSNYVSLYSCKIVNYYRLITSEDRLQDLFWNLFQKKKVHENDFTMRQKKKRKEKNTCIKVTELNLPDLVSFLTIKPLLRAPRSLSQMEELPISS